MSSIDSTALEEVTVSGATSTQKEGTPKPTPPTTDDCPDPIGPHTAHQVDAAAAKEQATLYTTDAAVVDKAFAALDGAQGKYASAKAERKTAFGELKATLVRIDESLACILDLQDRDRLTTCWTEVLDDAGPVLPYCDEVDGVDCGCLPTDIAKLRALRATAVSCVTHVDKAFDDLAGLPKALGTGITELSTRATALEKQVNGRTEPERSFVEFLQLKRDFSKLEADWIDPADYWCKLKALFVLLVHRHTVSICLQIALLRWDKKKELDDLAQDNKAKNLVDLVLECSRQVPQSQTEATAVDQQPQADAKAADQQSQTIAPTVDQQSQTEAPAAEQESKCTSD
jgi:hypothetical protein